MAAAKLAKQKPVKLKAVKDKEIEKLVKNWERLMGEFETKVIELQVFGKPTIAIAREVYKITDKKLKDKKLDNEQKKELLELRKRAYDYTMEVKKLNLI